MHAKDAVVNQSSDGKAVETVNEQFPQLDVVTSLTLIVAKSTLIVEAIDSVDGGTFVVASQQEEVPGVLDFVCH